MIRRYHDDGLRSMAAGPPPPSAQSPFANRTAAGLENHDGRRVVPAPAGPGPFWRALAGVSEPRSQCATGTPYRGGRCPGPRPPAAAADGWARPGPSLQLRSKWGNGIVDSGRPGQRRQHGIREASESVAVVGAAFKFRWPRAPESDHVVEFLSGFSSFPAAEPPGGPALAHHSVPGTPRRRSWWYYNNFRVYKFTASCTAARGRLKPRRFEVKFSRVQHWKCFTVHSDTSASKSESEGRGRGRCQCHGHSNTKATITSFKFPWWRAHGPRLSTRRGRVTVYLAGRW